MRLDCENGLTADLSVHVMSRILIYCLYVFAVLKRLHSFTIYLLSLSEQVSARHPFVTSLSQLHDNMRWTVSSELT